MVDMAINKCGLTLQQKFNIIKQIHVHLMTESILKTLYLKSATRTVYIPCLRLMNKLADRRKDRKTNWRLWRFLWVSLLMHILDILLIGWAHHRKNSSSCKDLEIPNYGICLHICQSFFFRQMSQYKNTCFHTLEVVFIIDPQNGITIYITNKWPPRQI